MSKQIIPIELIEKSIFIIRSEKIMLDRDLAELYQVTTKALNQAVKRNLERFPSEFMFQLNKQEKDELVTNCDRLGTLKHSTSLPYAFTEQGVAMLSSILKSKRAIHVNIQIMKTFVQLRRMYLNNKELADKINELEKKYDKQFKLVFDALRALITTESPSKRKIGF
ncbi:MAG: DNA-binding protein [Ignavibacteriales bacterium CG18_big_fil_WC_8_21_14_2_50_31_20]|nr:MAG: DNA-binding protein [Ignavibacteriales bacterium CG18_big_fil_WC_8_21_14_2_50_31_20]